MSKHERDLFKMLIIVPIREKVRRRPPKDMHGDAVAAGGVRRRKGRRSEDDGHPGGQASGPWGPPP